MKYITSTTEKNKGFALLMGVLVSSVLLALTMVMFNISLKQITLSTVASDTQLAFYAADSGIECALYYDVKGINDESQFNIDNDAPPVGGTVTCATEPPLNTYNSPITIPDMQIGVPATFSLRFDDDTCATISALKTNGANNKIDTKIESRGYSTCDTSNPLRLERGLELNY